MDIGTQIRVITIEAPAPDPALAPRPGAQPEPAAQPQPAAGRRVKLRPTSSVQRARNVGYE